MTDTSFAAYIQDQLSALPSVSLRTMFGGQGMYFGHNTCFGIEFRSRLYFKVDTRNQPEYEAKGMAPFRPSARQTLRSFYEVPSSVIEDADELVSWARKAIAAAQANPHKPVNREARMRRATGLVFACALAWCGAVSAAEAESQGAGGGKQEPSPQYIILARRYGYIDQKGKVVIEPQFEWGDRFAEDRAAIKLEGHYGYIDKTGKIIAKPEYEAGWEFSQGLASVKKNGKYGYIDTNGTLAIAPQYDFGGRFAEDRARVKVGDFWGFIDKTGKMVVQPAYDEAWDFQDGLGRIQSAGAIGYVNAEGQVVWKPTE